jgi:hypothetical protein
VRAALGETAGSEGNDAIRLAQLIGHLANYHLDQRAMIPWHRPDEVLPDLALDIDQGGDCLGMLAIKVGQETRQREMHMTLAGLGLKSLLRGHHEVAETVHNGCEHIGGNDTVAPQFRLPLCPHRCHLFASSPWPVDTGFSLEAIVVTIRYVIQKESKEEIQ